VDALEQTAVAVAFVRQPTLTGQLGQRGAAVRVRTVGGDQSPVAGVVPGVGHTLFVH